MRKLLVTAALLLCGHITHAVELTVVTAKGYVRFTVPDEWQGLNAQTKPPLAAIAFQIPNSADDGTSHSTNVTVSIRFAWPALLNNPTDYDKSMAVAMQAVQKSVAGGLGIPPARSGEVIRRPAQ